MLHEILGLNGDIRAIAERFASAGYAALAPDLYAGTGIRPLCIVRTLRSLGRGEGPALDAIETARRWLAARPEVDGARMGVVGFCMERARGVVAAWPAGIALASFDEYLDEILRMIDVLGIDGVAIGTDMDANYQPVVTNHRQFPDLAADLLGRGLAEAEVGAVLGGNLVRLFAQVLG